jgi:hypothetical protein
VSILPKEWYHENEVQRLQREVQQLRKALAEGSDKMQIARDQLDKEMRLHNEVYQKLQMRKEFFDWLKATYPEIIEQYEAAMKLVRFMEDPPAPKKIQSPFASPPRNTFGRHDPYSIFIEQAKENIKKAQEKSLYGKDETWKF